MKAKFKILIISITILVFTSCIQTREYVGQVIKKETVANPTSKTILVTGVADVRVHNFSKTFKKNYQDNQDFVTAFINEFELEANKQNLFLSISRNNFNKEGLLSNQNSDDNLNLILLEAKEDYIINFTNFEVTNRIETRNVHSMGPTGFAGGQTTSVEYCIINTKVVVYDVKSKKQILEFVSIGESSVFLFDFTETFKKSKNRAVNHVINYLKTGKTTYNKY